jgi:protein TonB
MIPKPVAVPTDPIDAPLPPQELPTPPEPAPQVPSESLQPITPERYNPNAPPEPLTYSEMLREQANAADPFGPDRDIDDIVREQLAQQGNDDDSVSFHDLPSRFDSYFYKFARSIYGTWRYPEAAAQRGEQGIVRVTFDITRAGKIANVNLLESSGYSDLDREVLRTLRAMAPVPLPETYENELLHINGYFIYTQSGQYRLY